MAVVGTAYGKIRGAESGGVAVFKGVPYGAPTGGVNRFKPPRAPTPWSGVREAIRFGESCPQRVLQHPPDRVTSAMVAELSQADDPSLTHGEDCLVLNVWTPEAAPTRQRPVMVWLHGGAFTMGTGSTAMFDGARLAKTGDTVVVTLNHRLGAFGFLRLDEIGGAAFAGSGAVGMLDIVAALQWVRDNIAEFGGDPANVTIFGESGGGGKVCALLSMPSAKGLFHRAVIQSGPFPRGNSVSLAQETAQAFLAELNLSGRPIEDLQSMDARKLVGASVATEARIKGGRLIDGSMGCWAPATDGVIMPYDPIDPRAGAIAPDVPVMIGATKDELTFHLFHGVPDYGSITEEHEALLCQAMSGSPMEEARRFYRELYPRETPSYRLASLLSDLSARHPTTRLAEARAAHARAPVYLYALTWRTPVLGGILRSPHVLDIPLIFGTLDVMRPFVGEGPDLDAVALQMSSTWLAFARNGVPDNPTIPPWPAYGGDERPTMLFDVKSRVVNDYDSAIHQFWDRHG